VGKLDARWRHGLSRRRAIAGLAGMIAGSPLLPRGLSAQADPRPFTDHRRIPGLEEMRTAFDFEPVMFSNVPLRVYDYTAHGDGSEFTVRRNRQAFDWVDLVPGRGVEPRAVDLATDLLGTRMAFPILVAPTAYQGAIHPDGETGMHAGAAAAANTPMVISQNSTVAVDRVAAAAAASPLWCQFYPQEDRAGGRRMLESYQAAGAKAIVVTVDQQASYYERSLHDRNLGGVTPSSVSGFRRGGAPPARGPALYRASGVRLWYSWDYLDELRQIVKVPLVVKGILTAEDARICVDRGIDAIIVSNHGGRSMDYAASSLEVLPEIIAAVGGRIPVITDSGYRKGADILKALAFGASAVMLGRATRWALGAFGPQGVQRLLEIMQRELVEAAGAAGCSTRAAITPAIVRTRFP
jgi:isopentenyl diphosphate isomerase/L-lactate dehydrogenase-like FMN-dependent dehydrogenase